MKLREWAEKTGVKYLTAYRWFKAGTLPVKSYQTESGTIIVDDPELSEQQMASNANSIQNDVMSIFLKKMVEFSKINASVEDFAAYIISNFVLKLPSTPETGPKYSRNKPKAEEVQKYFQQFLKKGDKPVPHIAVGDIDTIDDLVAKADTLSTKELVSEISKIGEIKNDAPDVAELQKIVDAFKGLQITKVKTYDKVYGGVIARSIHDSTPQTYTDFSDDEAAVSLGQELSEPEPILVRSVSAVGATGAFKPTKKELESASKAIKSAGANKKTIKSSRKK